MAINLKGTKKERDQPSSLTTETTPWLSRLFYSIPYERRVLGLTVMYLIVAVGAFPAHWLLVIVGLVLLHRHSRELAQLKALAQQISAGDDSPVPRGKLHKKPGELGDIARVFTRLSQDFSQSLVEQMKSERMKTELLTHVSHDIRTPLTSLITYVDLLKKESQPTEAAQSYLTVIENKAHRLNALVSDLFEASKAASGNIELEVMPMNLTDCIQQALGELEGMIEGSGLTFVTDFIPDAYVLADGRLLWRIVENLVSNVCKYSLAGSRVYLKVEQLEDQMCLSIKNTSNHPLNITPDELMAKFVRGDLARHTEGSGLGLSIVQSFVQAQQGRFDIDIDIDADLFKCRVLLPATASTRTDNDICHGGEAK